MTSNALLQSSEIEHSISFEQSRKILDHNLLQYDRIFQMGDLMGNMRNILWHLSLKKCF